MQAKNNRLNSNFQILHFLIGSCHTADAAYALLCDLRDERQMALDNEQVQSIKKKASIITANRLLLSDDEVDRLNAEADLTEYRLSIPLHEKNLNAAEAELKFIDECILRLQPYRKYSHLPDEEAHQACQQEEWLQELIFRAQNYLMTTGSIHVDHFSTMRMHPEFLSKIIPAITQAKEAIENGTIERLMTPKNDSPKSLLSSFIKESEESMKLLQKFD